MHLLNSVCIIMVIITSSACVLGQSYQCLDDIAHLFTGIFVFIFIIMILCERVFYQNDLCAECVTYSIVLNTRYVSIVVVRCRYHYHFRCRLQSIEFAKGSLLLRRCQ